VRLGRAVDCVPNCGVSEFSHGAPMLTAGKQKRDSIGPPTPTLSINPARGKQVPAVLLHTEGHMGPRRDLAQDPERDRSAAGEGAGGGGGVH
jgi:hypothetical protein